jgi:3-mercaptopyruvate sulfurtransferase SseA
MDHLDQVVVVDAQSEKAYKKGHIPGGVSSPWQPFTHTDGKPGNPGWGALLPKKELAAKIGALGIDGRRPLVVYADPPGWGEDGRFVWMAVMAGLQPEYPIVTYCTAGIRSAHMALVLRMAGFANARNYDASFYEWAGMEDLPLEK